MYIYHAPINALSAQIHINLNIIFCTHVDNKNSHGNNISGDWFGVIPTWHYQQEHQWKQHQLRLIWCHANLALPTRTSMETRSVETDLVSYQLRITNKNISGQQEHANLALPTHQWKRDQWRPIWCHTNFALPTRTSVETTSVETDLVSYWLGITNLMLYQLGILIIVLVLSQLVVTDLVLHSVLNYVILSWYYTNWVLYAWHYTDLVLTWCYTNLVLYWLGVILTWCYTDLVLYKLGVILTWCYTDLVLYKLGVILTWCYTDLVLYKLGVILTWCYTPVPPQDQGAAQTLVLLSCRCHQMSSTPCSWTWRANKIHVTVLNWDRGVT